MKIELEKSLKPWERQPNESDKCYEAFCHYRDFGRDRTIDKTAAFFGKTHSTIGNMAFKWRWTERVKAWIDELDKRRRDATLREVQEMAKRHAQQAMMHQKILLLPAEAILKRLQADPNGKIKDFDGLNIDKLYEKAVDGASAFCKVVDIERKSRGEPIDISKQDITSGGEPIRVILPPNIKVTND